MKPRDKRPTLPNDQIRVEYFKASGPGGQRNNKREPAVRVRHLPTGITVIATEHRSQARNKALALKRITLRLSALKKHRTPRVPTTIPRSHWERVLAAKHHHARIKRWRSKTEPFDLQLLLLQGIELLA